MQFFSAPIISNTTIQNCFFLEGGKGAGLYGETGSTPRVYQTVVQRNQAWLAGGICLTDTEATFSEVVVRDNVASYGGGVGAWEVRTRSAEPTHLPRIRFSST